MATDTISIFDNYNWDRLIEEYRRHLERHIIRNFNEAHCGVLIQDAFEKKEEDEVEDVQF